MKRGDIKHKLHLFLEVTEVIQSKSPAIVKKQDTKPNKEKQTDSAFPIAKQFYYEYGKHSKDRNETT